MNKCILLGRLTAEPEVRFTQSGKQITDITLAVDDGFGENKKTSFINCTAWEKKAEIIGNSVSKGQKLLVVGRWCQQSWETQEGQKRRKDFLTIEEIEFVEKKKEQTPAESFGQEVDLPEEFNF